MAPLERLTQTNDLKVTHLQKMAAGRKIVRLLNYDDVSDTLIFLFCPPDTPTIVHYIDEYVALLYDPNNKEVLGIQIENFESGFLSDNDEIQRIWRLSDSCENLNIKNLGDISIVFEKKKPEVAQELARYTEALLGGQSGRHRARVHA